ncbi:hypothetical protein Tco_0532517 [Tanacetum coccineum]
MQRVPYALALGSIMHIVRCTRPGVAFAQNLTSKFQKNPGAVHWSVVKNILKYLRTTRDMFLVFGGDLNGELRIVASEAAIEAVWIRKFISKLRVIPINEEPMNMHC